MGHKWFPKVPLVTRQLFFVGYTSTPSKGLFSTNDTIDTYKEGTLNRSTLSSQGSSSMHTRSGGMMSSSETPMLKI